MLSLLQDAWLNDPPVPHKYYIGVCKSIAVGDLLQVRVKNNVNLGHSFMGQGVSTLERMS